MVVARALQIIYAATPLICWCLNACIMKRRILWAPLFAVTCITGYFILLASVQAAEYSLD